MPHTLKSYLSSIWKGASSVIENLLEKSCWVVWMDLESSGTEIPFDFMLWWGRALLPHNHTLKSRFCIITQQSTGGRSNDAKVGRIWVVLHPADHSCLASSQKSWLARKEGQGLQFLLMQLINSTSAEKSTGLYGLISSFEAAFAQINSVFLLPGKALEGTIPL